MEVKPAREEATRNFPSSLALVSSPGVESKKTRSLDKVMMRSPVGIAGNRPRVADVEVPVIGGNRGRNDVSLGEREVLDQVGLAIRW